MTEAEWRASTNLFAMSWAVRGRASERKLIRLAIACGRRAMALSDNPRLLAAIDAVERMADGLIDEAELDEVQRPDPTRSDAFGTRTRDDRSGTSEDPPDSALPRQTPFDGMTEGPLRMSVRLAPRAARYSAEVLASLQGEEQSPEWFAAVAAEEARQCELFRDIIGDPFRPFEFAPAWLAGEGAPAVGLAHAIDEGRLFDDLTPLADALERAGCRDRAVLDHCRSGGPHVRGCWVVDALLERENLLRPGLTTEAAWQSHEDIPTLLQFLILWEKGTDRQWRLFAVACCRRIGDCITDERSRRAVAVAARYAEGLATEAELDEARAAAERVLDETSQQDRSPSSAALAAWAAVHRVRHRARYVRPGTPFDQVFWRPRLIGEEGPWSMAAQARIDKKAGHLDTNSPDWRSWPLNPLTAEWESERRAQCDLLRDIFGEFFGPPGDEGEWLGDERLGEWWCLLPTRRDFEGVPAWSGWRDGLIPALARSIYDREAFDELPILADALEDAGCEDAAALAHLRGPGPHVRGCWVLDRLLGGWPNP